MVITCDRGGICACLLVFSNGRARRAAVRRAPAKRAPAASELGRWLQIVFTDIADAKQLQARSSLPALRCDGELSPAAA